MLRAENVIQVCLNLRVHVRNDFGGRDISQSLVGVNSKAAQEDHEFYTRGLQRLENVPHVI